MNHKEGHELVEECLGFLLGGPIKDHNLYSITMDLKIGYDDCDGHFYGFEYKSNYKSEVIRHEGETELCSVTYYAESEDVIFCFDNNGYTQEIETLEDFKKYLTFGK